jgi:hypothetical protein
MMQRSIQLARGTNGQPVVALLSEIAQYLDPDDESLTYFEYSSTTGRSWLWLIQQKDSDGRFGGKDRESDGFDGESRIFSAGDLTGRSMWLGSWGGYGGFHLGELMTNPAYFTRMKRLQGIVVWELHDLLVELNLGIETEAAFVCARQIVIAVDWTGGYYTAAALGGFGGRWDDEG